MSDVWSAFPDAAPSGAAATPAADPWAAFPDAGAKGDRLPMAPGAVLHAMPADTVSRDLPTITPGGSDIGASIGSRLVAGVMDIPGMIGDIPNAIDTLTSAGVEGVRGLFGVSPERRQQAAAISDQLIKGQLSPVSPLNILPGSEDIKQAVGFQAYRPQTAAGKIFDKYVGPAVEILPTLGGGIVRTALKTAAEQGTKAAIKQGTGAVIKQAIAPAAASEVAGDVTKGTPFEVPARLLAAVVAGKGAGVTRGKLTGAPSIEDWRKIGNQAFDDMKAVGVGVKPSSFDRMVSDAEQALHEGDYLPGLHEKITPILDKMKAAEGVPKSFNELVQFHRMASRQMGNIDKDTARVAGLLADHIGNYIENLQPKDLIAGSDPKAALNAWMKGKDAWRKMRTGERIANIIEGSLDTQGANYTSAGQQTALRQAFKRFKWKGGVGKEYSREYLSLPPEGKSMVESMIRGVSVVNALRQAGKFNLKNPLVQVLLTGLGATLNPGVIGAAGLAAFGSGARALSARSTIRQASQLGDLVRGGQWVPRRLGRTPNPIIFGAAAQRATDQSKQGGQ